jgi:carbohydrate kinase (thermoresistant glucokinase family)
MNSSTFPGNVIIVMGVSGSGKTTVGQLLAERLNLPFYDGDDFHPAANIAKMKAGTPLTDADRSSWLATLAEAVADWQTTGGAVLACSALREVYRQTLQHLAHRPLQWVFLDGPDAVLHARLEARKGHYMKAQMLDSQLETLERPAYGLRVSIELPPTQAVAEIVAHLGEPVLIA